MDTRVSRTIAFLEQTDFRAVSSAQLAGRVGVSPSRLQHLFKDEVGCSIRHYVRKRRLWRAAVLLASSDLRISEVLWNVGFTDAANFTHAFKREYGVTPSKFRERAWRREHGQQLRPTDDVSHQEKPASRNDPKPYIDSIARGAPRG